MEDQTKDYDGEKRGPKPKYKPEYVEMARKLCEKYGAIDTELADVFEVSKQTLYNWQRQHPEFRDAMTLGKAQADQRVEERLFMRAMGYEHPETKVFNHNGDIVTHEVMKYYPPDTVACIFWLKNRKPKEWRDRVEHTGDEGGPIDVRADINDLEVARRVGFLLTKGIPSEGLSGASH